MMKMVAETTIAPSSGNQPLRVTLSIGLARLVPGEEAGQWLERADKALYAAKRAGRAQVMTADQVNGVAGPC